MAHPESKILKAIEGKATLTPHEDGFIIDWELKDRGSIFVTPERLAALEAALAKEGLLAFDDVFFGSLSMVLKSGDKVAHISDRKIETQTYETLNPALAQGEAAERLHYVISKYMPIPIEESAYLVAIQASLMASHGLIYTDSSKENTKGEMVQITLFDEKGVPTQTTVTRPWIVDMEHKAYVEAPWAKKGIGSAEYYVNDAWSAGDTAIQNAAVRTSSHEVFVLKDKPLYDVLCEVAGKNGTHFEAHVLDTSKLKILPNGSGADPSTYSRHPLYVMAVKNPDIMVRHNEEGEAHPFSLRMLMEEAQQLLAQKQQR